MHLSQGKDFDGSEVFCLWCVPQCFPGLLPYGPHHSKCLPEKKILQFSNDGRHTKMYIIVECLEKMLEGLATCTVTTMVFLEWQGHWIA